MHKKFFSSLNIMWKNAASTIFWKVKCMTVKGQPDPNVMSHC